MNYMRALYYAPVHTHLHRSHKREELDRLLPLRMALRLRLYIHLLRHADAVRSSCRELKLWTPRRRLYRVTRPPTVCCDCGAAVSPVVTLHRHFRLLRAANASYTATLALLRQHRDPDPTVDPFRMATWPSRRPMRKLPVKLLRVDQLFKPDSALPPALQRRISRHTVSPHVVLGRFSGLIKEQLAIPIARLSPRDKLLGPASYRVSTS